MSLILYHTSKSNSIQVALWPEQLRVLPGPGDHLAWRTARFEGYLKDKSLQPSMHCIVAVKDSAAGEVIVGCAEWIAPTVSMNGKPEREKLWEEVSRELPDAMCKPAMKEHVEETKKFEAVAEQILGPAGVKDMWVARSIAVNQEYQGRGIGTILTQWGLEQAELGGKDVYLVASAEGANLYRRLGFVELCSSEILGEKRSAMIKQRVSTQVIDSPCQSLQHTI
ncbi:hypothetical protein TruAng_004422 [Truncatella angustata]|nr:hypothetical protein TruAng_004422 [Truncatella angustata]